MVSIQSILLGAFAFAQTVSAGNCNLREGDVIALKADTGKYVTRCRNCIGGAAYPDSVNFQGPINSGTPYSYWTVVDAGNGKIALKGDLGNYLSRCNNCAPGASYPDEAFVHVSDWKSGPWSQWTCEDADNGKIALKADTGKYLARCNGCVRSGPADVAFVHAPAWRGSPWAQFEVEFLKRASNCIFKDGDVIALQADTGKYVTRCRNCISGAAYPDSVNLQSPINAGTPYSYWTVYNTGDGKIALKGDLGNYLSRCNNCVPGAAYPDEAFVHVSDWKSGPWAQFTCEDASNGKIALKADTGKYVTRCNNCVPGGPSDVITMHVNNWRDGDYAQFTVVKKPASACSFKDGEVIALQADTGKYVTRCRNCISGAAYPDSVNLQSPINDGTPYSYWTVYNTGDGKIALKGDLGNYLSRCNNCVRGAAYPDEAFVHVSDWRSGPWAQFTCEEASNGKIALKADTGKYVTRCNGCVPGGPSDVITMHVNNWRDGDYAQFTVVKKPVVLAMSINQETAEPNRVVLVLGSMFAGSCLALLGMFVYNRRRVPATADERKGLNPL